MEVKELKGIGKTLEYLVSKVESLEQSMQGIISSKKPMSEWMGINELREYIPSHPARQTIYEWVQARIIPFHKNTKMLIFNKKEIDIWLHGGYRKTLNEIESDANKYLDSKRK